MITRLHLFSLLFLILMPTGDYELRFSGSVPGGECYADHLGNVYFLTGHRLVKFDAASGETLEYGTIADGEITSTDVTNPLQLLVFYRDFNRIVFLDSKLSRLRPAINLHELGIEQGLLVCNSGRGGMWVFSDRENRLVYFDSQFRNTHQSRNIGSIAGHSGSPVYITEAQNLLYLHIPRKGILVFDRFASYLQTIPYEGPDRFVVSGGKIIYFLDGELTALDPGTGDVHTVDLPDLKRIDNAILQGNNLVILAGEKFSVYERR